MYPPKIDVHIFIDNDYHFRYNITIMLMRIIVNEIL